MRISDWSSDVCSSELLETGGGQSFRSGGQGREAACLSDELCASGRCRMGYGLSGRAGGSASNPWHAAYWRGYGLPAQGCARCFHLDRQRGGSGQWSAGPEWGGGGGTPLCDRDGWGGRAHV